MLTLSTNQLADILDVSPSTIRTWIQLKKIRAVKTCNQEGNYIRDSSLFDFLKTHPQYMQKFMHKLFQNSTFCGMDSKEVWHYLQRKGYLP